MRGPGRRKKRVKQHTRITRSHRPWNAPRGGVAFVAATRRAAKGVDPRAATSPTRSRASPSFLSARRSGHRLDWTRALRFNTAASHARRWQPWRSENYAGCDRPGAAPSARGGVRVGEGHHHLAIANTFSKTLFTRSYDVGQNSRIHRQWSMGRSTRLQRLNCRSILSSPKTRLQKPRRFLSHAIHQSSFFTPRRTRMMMKPDESSAEVASRAIEATEAATAASTEAASLETTVALERAALRARRDRDVCQGDATKTRAPSDGPRTPTEANARARRTKEAENETRRARETARMRAAGLGPPGERVGDGSARDGCGSEFALDEKARESWQRHELQWARFEADNDLISDDTDDESPRRRLTLHDVPFPSSGSGLLVSLVAFGVGGETSAQNQNGKIVEKEKAAASLAVARRVAAMRWHPDKFTQKFGKRLAVVMSATDRAEVDRIVVETYQDIQRTFQSLTRSK